MIPYSFDIEDAKSKLNDWQAKRILIQLPEGLKIYYKEIIELFKEYEVLISGKPCFGACDIETDFKNLGVDAVLQIGHARIPNLKVPERYIFLKVQKKEFRYKKALKDFIEKSDKKNIGLVASIQYIHYLPEIKQYLEKEGFQVTIEKKGKRTLYDGQVLGCDFTTARNISGNIDIFICLADGDFYAIGIELATRKPTYLLDGIEIRRPTEKLEKILRQRFAAITLAQEANRFGIIISSKPGQNRLNLALKIKKLLKEKNKEAYLITLNDITQYQLMCFDAEVFISTACPRIAVDDYLSFEKPILTPLEIEIAFNLKKWEDYKLDEIQEI